LEKDLRRCCTNGTHQEASFFNVRVAPILGIHREGVHGVVRWEDTLQHVEENFL
jgi:hypothetical protein